MKKQLVFRISRDGSIKAWTKNIKGPECARYASMMAQMADARIITQERTPEYYEQELKTEEAEDTELTEEQQQTIHLTDE